MKKADIQLQPRVSDRITFLYLEHCRISRQDGAIEVLDERGKCLIPAATVSVLLLGPGTEITHRAVELIGNAGTSLVWVGEQGVRYYASGVPLTHRSTLLEQQAKLVLNQRTRLQVAKKMYQMRFPNEDVKHLSMQALRGKEGTRMRKVYERMAQETDVEWHGRSYQVDDFSKSDAVNQALTAGNACLYGICHSVIAALGCSPALGFVHTGHERSFVYDVADLYKAQITIPLAFELASECPREEIATEMRHRCRDRFREMKLLKQIVSDLFYLLDVDEELRHLDVNVLELWDTHGNVSGRKSYASRPSDSDSEEWDER
ncbi:MAG: type I-E CRISPR-associated endonuclease Cas1e [Aerococcus sp.]|nr:type I-E CRISPR-associated endonuclease Cas1e [Aerococcus sp.]